MSTRETILVDEFLTAAKESKIAVYMVYGHMTPGQLNIFNVSNVPKAAVLPLKRQLLGLGSTGRDAAAKALHEQREGCLVCETYCSNVLKEKWDKLTPTEQGFHVKAADIVIEAIVKHGVE